MPAFLLNPLVVVFIAGLVVVVALKPQQRARARAQAVAEQTPALTELAAKLGGFFPALVKRPRGLLASSARGSSQN
jgi:hypothetical protein